MGLICGWCGHTTAGSPCSSCGRDAVLPWTQRGLEPPTVRTDAVGRPPLDVAAIRRQLREATAALQSMGGTVTNARLAELLGVSDKTIRRWRELAG